MALHAGDLAAVRRLEARAAQAKGAEAFHVPAALLLRCLRGLRAARKLSEVLQAQAPQWLRESVVALAGVLAPQFRQCRLGAERLRAQPALRWGTWRKHGA